MGNQVVRRDERARRFAGEVFALPLYLQMRFCQLLLCLAIIVGLRLFGLLAAHVVLVGDSPLEAFESALCFAQEAGGLDRLSR